MYKVFVNETPIILSTQKSVPNYQTIPLEDADLPGLVNKITKSTILDAPKLHLCCSDWNAILPLLFSKIPVLVAAGGKVYNTKNETLFIKRKGKWDLPKGGVEESEDIATAALREVTEETGVDALHITKFLRRTFHVFERNAIYFLKVTYWFEMRTSFEGKGTPQTEEEITKVSWKNRKKTEKALKKTYENIKLLFSASFFNSERV